jgi:spore coat polysaccharide biosynthesis protein SpsF (cytidylyltransferase family)
MPLVVDGKVIHVMTVVAVIQARMGSTRPPRKVVLQFRKRPMVDWLIERARRIPGVVETVVATSALAQENHLSIIQKRSVSVDLTR